MLIVSPHFPPVNAPDMQRIRASLPYFAECGWNVHVLAVAPDQTAQAIDERLLDTVPPEIPVTRVRAISARLTSWFGLRNLGWRAWIALFRAGSRLLRTTPFDVIYFSTTQFICLPMGRIWRSRYGVPYVIDLQDPWLNDYYSENPHAARPGGHKYLLAHTAAKLLESWTLRRCSGVIAVSATYLEVLRRRYVWMSTVPTTTLSFGVDDRDLQVLQRRPVAQDLFGRKDGEIPIVSIGRGGDDLLKAAGMLFAAVAEHHAKAPAIAPRLHVYFAGTNYASAGQAQPMFETLAARHGIAGQFTERPWRLGYFESLQCQIDAGAIVILGSDDASYSPSKLHAVLMTGRPVLAIVLANSTVERQLAAFPSVRKLVFKQDGRPAAWPANIVSFWNDLLSAANPAEKSTRAAQAGGHEHHARPLTHAQGRFLDQVVEANAQSPAQV